MTLAEERNLWYSNWAKLVALKNVHWGRGLTRIAYVTHSDLEVRYPAGDYVDYKLLQKFRDAVDCRAYSVMIKAARDIYENLNKGN